MDDFGGGGDVVNTRTQIRLVTGLGRVTMTERNIDKSKEYLFLGFYLYIWGRERA